MSFTKDGKKYRIWVVALRIILMGIPALLAIVSEWLLDKSENILMWLDFKLPDPKNPASPRNQD